MTYLGDYRYIVLLDFPLQFTFTFARYIRKLKKGTKGELAQVILISLIKRSKQCRVA